MNKELCVRHCKVDIGPIVAKLGGIKLQHGSETVALDALLASPHSTGWPKKEIKAVEAELRAYLHLEDAESEGTIIRSLPPGTSIQPHLDRGNLLTGGRRFHFPLVTHPDITMTWVLDDLTMHMEAGYAWEVDATKMHRIDNPSSIDRVLLIIDLLPKGRMELTSHEGTDPQTKKRYFQYRSVS